MQDKVIVKKSKQFLPLRVVEMFDDAVACM